MQFWIKVAAFACFLMLQKLTMPSTPHKHSYAHSSPGESGYANQDGEDEELNLAGELGEGAERRARTQV